MEEISAIGELVDVATGRRGRKKAIIFEGKEITYKDFNAHVNRVANGLRKLGVKEGEVVAIMLPNIPEFLYSFFGIQRMGAVAVTVNPMYKGGEIEHILGDSGAKVIIALTNFVPMILEIKPELPKLEHIVVTGERSLHLIDPEATMTVQMVVDQADFPDVEEAYRKVGRMLVEVFSKLGVEGVWYKHMGGIRVGGSKIAGFSFGEIEDVLIMTAVCFLAELQAEEFFEVVWVPPEVKDKALEPLTSVEELTGKRPEDDLFCDIVVECFKAEFGLTVKEGSLMRDEKFGYEKQRALAQKK